MSRVRWQGLKTQTCVRITPTRKPRGNKRRGRKEVVRIRGGNPKIEEDVEKLIY